MAETLNKRILPALAAESRENARRYWAKKTAPVTCTNHPDRPSRVKLDGDELCQECADAWVRAEGAHQAWEDAHD